MNALLAIIIATSLLPPPPESPAAETNAPAATPALTSSSSVDEIDLDEVDDSAEAAKKPQVKTDAANLDFVDVSCDNATLDDVLRQFRKTTRANIICSDSTNLQKRVSAELKHVPWLDALQSILNSRGFRIEERGSIYFINEDKELIPVLTKSFVLNHASSDELANLFNANYGKKDATGKVTQKIANSFAAANVVVVTAPEKTLVDCEQIIKSVDRAVPQVYIEARFLQLSSEAMHKLGMQWDSLASWGVSANHLNAGWSVNNSSPSIYRSAVKNQTETSSDSSSEDSSQRSNQKSLNSTKTFETLMPSTIMEATAAGYSAADMNWRKASIFSGQLSAQDFSLALSAFESLGEGKIFSNPKIIVSNGKEAKVDMTTKEPNVTVEANYTGTSSQNLNISTKMDIIPGEDKQMFAGEAFFSYGITLSVKPRISPDGLITVEIIPTISEHSGDKTIKNAGEDAVYTTYPKITVKRLTTEFTMNDGATAVIGGLTQTTEEDVDTGIPLLRHIPWIGPRIFGWKSREKVQSEIIVCVTVGIADPQNLPKDIGLPKNAVLGREYVIGRRLEPGDRVGNADTVLSLDMTSLDDQHAERESAGSVIITPSAAE